MTLSVARSLLMFFLLGLFVLLLGAACGGNEEASGGGNEEANAGGGGGGEEAAGIGDFADWDTNNNDEINQEEFNMGAFQNWDVDNNDEITQEEFNDTTPTGFEKFNDVNDFNDWNTGDDEVLTQEEFNAHPGIEGGDLFERYDANNDNAIVLNEFNEGVAQGGDTTMQGGTTMQADTTTMQGGTTTMQGGVITDIQKLVNAQNPQSLIGRQVQLQSAKVQEVPGDISFLIGPNANQTVFAVLGDELVGAQAEQAVNVNAGQTLAINGVVRRTPSVQQAQQNLGLTRAEARQLQNQPFFLFVQEVQAIR